MKKKHKQKVWRPNKLHCNFSPRPRKRAVGTHHWNTHKGTPNKHVKQEWCESNGKYLRKWTKTCIMIYFGTQNDPEIGPPRPIFNTPLKVAQVDMYTKIDVKPTSGNFLRKWPKTLSFTYFGGPKWPKNSASEAHILRTSKNTRNELVKQYCADVKPVKTFEKVTKHQNLDSLWDKKWPRNWYFEVHIVHISESSSSK